MNDLGPERPRGLAPAPGEDLAAEHEAHLVRAADVEVVANELLEEDAAGEQPVQGHGGGEPGLLDRQLPAEAGLFVLVRERVRLSRRCVSRGAYGWADRRSTLRSG